MKKTQKIIQNNTQKKFQANSEIRIYGLNACEKVIERRFMDCVCLFVDEKLFNKFKKIQKILKLFSENKKPYHLVSSEELESLSQSTHHEGIVLVAKKHKTLNVNDLLSKLRKNVQTTKQSHKEIYIALDRVTNPHNIGAILRSMAHFRCDGLILLGCPKSIVDSGAMIRTAEGGHESVPIYLEDLGPQNNLPNENLGRLKFFQELRSLGFDILSTSSHQGESLFHYTLKPKTIFLFGAEDLGLSPELLKAFPSIQISGSGNVESLNVSVATALCAGQFYQTYSQDHLKNTLPKK